MVRELITVVMCLAIGTWGGMTIQASNISPEHQELIEFKSKFDNMAGVIDEMKLPLRSDIK